MSAGGMLIYSKECNEAFCAGWKPLKSFSAGALPLIPLGEFTTLPRPSHLILPPHSLSFDAYGVSARRLRRRSLLASSQQSSFSPPIIRGLVKILPEVWWEIAWIVELLWRLATELWLSHTHTMLYLVVITFVCVCWESVVCCLLRCMMNYGGRLWNLELTQLLVWYFNFVHEQGGQKIWRPFLKVNWLVYDAIHISKC